MKTIRATSLRESLYETLQELAVDREPVEIVLKGKSVGVLMPSPSLSPGRRKPLLDLDGVATFCKEHKVKSFALFGSVLRDDFDEESDVDVLVDLAEPIPDFHAECRMIDELEALFGRRVDMLTTAALKSPRMNPHRRESISSTAKVIYDATA
jgi:predicted nucleotidyltransferase